MDADPHVRLQAIDLLGGECPQAEGPSPELAALVGELSARPREWHAPAHAIVSLARRDPAAAAQVLPRFVEHPTWQVRMYAARAAGVLGARACSSRSERSHDNVREAAWPA